MFFVNNWKRIVDLVSTVFNSLNEIAFGRIGKAAGFILGSLIKAVPIVISFLARLLNISGIVKKVQQVIGKIKKPVDKAVGKVVGWVVKTGKKLWARVKGVFGKKEKPPKNKKEHDAQVKAGLSALAGEGRKNDGDNDGALTLDEAEKTAKRVKKSYPAFKSITPVETGDHWSFNYVASPQKEKKTQLKVKKNYSLPAWSKITVDWDEVFSGHVKGGERLHQGKHADVFPDCMSANQIKKAIKIAYTNARKIREQFNPATGELRFIIQGKWMGNLIEMWFNKTNNELETAYPQKWGYKI